MHKSRISNIANMSFNAILKENSRGKLRIYGMALFVCFMYSRSLFCFTVQYFVSFVVLQQFHWGRESWLLYFCCVLNVISL